MKPRIDADPSTRPLHPWLKQVRVSYLPGPTTPLLEEVTGNILDQFEALGHVLDDSPGEETDAVLTTAAFGEPVPWRQAHLFTIRRQFGLRRAPTVVTLMHITPEQFLSSLDHFARALQKATPDPRDYEFPGLAPEAYRVLHEQGRRGGPILALERLLQAQTKSIRVLLLVGQDEPERMYHFDLVGAHPESQATDSAFFYSDIVLRLVTSLSTSEITAHQVVGDQIPRSQWEQLATPPAMRAAALSLGKRHFFTQMVRIADLVKVPAVAEAVSSQYSEGCFTTWDPDLGALIATVTGSARPVDKDNITEDDLAVIVGVRPDGKGALVRHVEGKSNDPPSSEAVEMMDMDSTLPRIELPASWGVKAHVPVIRSKLHGHRGVSAYDGDLVEHVPLDPPYYHFPVSCATEAQATGIKQAFARSRALQDPHDPRQVVFTVLPGHGVVVAEKWVPGTVPFQVMWEMMDADKLQIANAIPQGQVVYKAGTGSTRHLASG